MGKSSAGGGYVSLESKRKRLDEAIQSGEFKLASSQVPIKKVVDGRILVDLESRQYPDFTQSVSKGAQLLDQVDPEWYLSIDTSVLDLDDQNMCVLGQSWNHYKVVDSALAAEVTGANNFKRYLAALKKSGKIGSNALCNDGSEHGFAFSPSVYYWAHLEAQRRVDEGIYPSLNTSDIPGRTHRSWDLDAELWEHLTKTWLVLIEARQKAYAKESAEGIAALTQHFYNKGMSNLSARTEAETLYRKGIRIADLKKENSSEF